MWLRCSTERHWRRSGTPPGTAEPAGSTCSSCATTGSGSSSSTTTAWGMSAGRVEERREEGHLGLHALGELVVDAGGTLALHSAPGDGTRVEIRVPAQ